MEDWTSYLYLIIFELDCSIQCTSVSHQVSMLFLHILILGVLRSCPKTQLIGSLFVVRSLCSILAAGMEFPHSLSLGFFSVSNSWLLLVAESDACAHVRQRPLPTAPHNIPKLLSQIWFSIEKLYRGEETCALVSFDRRPSSSCEALLLPRSRAGNEDRWQWNFYFETIFFRLSRRRYKLRLFSASPLSELLFFQLNQRSENYSLKEKLLHRCWRANLNRVRVRPGGRVVRRVASIEIQQRKQSPLPSTNGSSLP